MKVFPPGLALLLTGLALFCTPGCNSKPRDQSSTVSLSEKEKHTKTKAHKRDKKEEKKKSGVKKESATSKSGA